MVVIPIGNEEPLAGPVLVNVGLPHVPTTVGDA
jgi:hypothetical protein